MGSTYCCLRMSTQSLRNPLCLHGSLRPGRNMFCGVPTLVTFLHADFFVVRVIPTITFQNIYLYIYSGYSVNLYDIYFDILFGICSGIYSDILSGILSGIQSDILFGIYSDMACGILSDIYSDILSEILSEILI